VEKEFYNARAIVNMDFAKPKAYEMIVCEDRNGIVYDTVDGESLLDWVRKTGDVKGCAVYMSKLHKAIVRNRVRNVSNYKEFLRYYIAKAPSFAPKKQTEVLQMLDKFPDGHTLCHGDFHPGNIFIAGGHTTVIDFMNICQGDFLYDVARTVFLVEYTPVSTEEKDRELLLQLKKTLVDLYLIQMNVTREIIQEYLSVITAARMGECPNEQRLTQE
ncbi:MAG TPA: phosphotransferase, partial [Bacillota bacterium]|nr:phosphotransferase [Bacillota bacterium]